MGYSLGATLNVTDSGPVTKTAPKPAAYVTPTMPTGTPYTPTAAELANANYWLAQAGYGRALTPWQLMGGTLFIVPSTTTPPGAASGPFVRFGWGAGDFAAFPGPANAATATAPAPIAPVLPPTLQPRPDTPPPVDALNPPPPTAAVPTPAPSLPPTLTARMVSPLIDSAAVPNAGAAPVTVDAVVTSSDSSAPVMATVERAAPAPSSMGLMSKVALGAIAAVALGALAKTPRPRRRRR